MNKILQQKQIIKWAHLNTFFFIKYPASLFKKKFLKKGKKEKTINYLQYE